MPIISNSTIGSSSGISPTAKGDLVTFSNQVVNFGIAPAQDGKVLTQKITANTGFEWKLPTSKGTTYSNSIFVIFDSTEESPISNSPMITTPDSSLLLSAGAEFNQRIGWSPPSNGNATNWRWIIDGYDFGTDTFKWEIRELPLTDTTLIASLSGEGIKTSSVNVALDSSKIYVYRITHTGSNTGKIENFSMTFDFFPT